MPGFNPLIPRIAFFASICVLGLAMNPASNTPAHAAQAQKQSKASATKPSPAAVAAQRYVQAMASGDRVAVGRLDFACQYRIVSSSTKRLDKYPPDADPVYAKCGEPIAEANNAVVERRELGMDVMWPGKGALVFFGEDLSLYPASAFVMELLGMSPPAGGLRAELVDTSPLPAASFRLRDEAPMVPAAATLVRLRIAYRDPLTSPVTYAEGAYKWTNTVKRPRQALKAITLKWVVLSGLRKHGFPGDVAVLNLPVAKLSDEAGGPREAIPFVTETSGVVPGSTVWWGPADAPGLMIAAVGRAVQYPDQRDRVALLNRVLIIDPAQPGADLADARPLSVDPERRCTRPQVLNRRSHARHLVQRTVLGHLCADQAHGHRAGNGNGGTLQADHCRCAVPHDSRHGQARPSETVGCREPPAPRRGLPLE
jgi:hypothetical protein